MRIGVDLGGTKIEAAAFAADGRERFRKRVATPQKDYDATIAAVASLVTEAERVTREIGTVGVGMPGAISPASGLVKNANSTCLNGRPLQQDLERVLGREVRLANDANCFALSEATDGAGRDARVVFGVIIGTGTGGGVVVDKKVLTGPTRSRASGATTRSRGRRTTSGPARTATAASEDASRRSSPVRA